MKEIDENEVNRIVENMKSKYREQGIEFDDVNSELGELRDVISNNNYSSIDITSEEDVEIFESPVIRQIGKFYIKFKKILEPIKQKISEFDISKNIEFYLYSANMHYSSNQYIAIATTTGFLAGIIALIISLFIGINNGNIIIAIILPIIFPIIVVIITIITVLMIPKQKAIAYGNACSIELPFALRHMSTELRSGVGLYKTINTIATNDYGKLSEEFIRTINEIEEGTDTRDALRHLSLRTQSQPLKQTINHILRVMRIGGNLSEIMNGIAEDVSEGLFDKINIFSQKMNFFSVIFIFAGIVLPVGIMILGTIRNSSFATGENLFKSIPLTPEIMILIYLVFLPMIFIGMIGMVYILQPKVS
jgi:archaeal flagellar protein FlaJ